MIVYTATVRHTGEKVRLMMLDMDSFISATPHHPVVCYTMEDEERIIYVLKMDITDLKPAE